MLSNCSRFVPRVITRISISRTKVNWQINNILFDLVVNSSVAYMLSKSVRNLMPFEGRICRPKIVEIPPLPIDISYIIVPERITIFRSVYQLYICQRESKIRSRQIRTCVLDNQIDWIFRVSFKIKVLFLSVRQIQYTYFYLVSFRHHLYVIMCIKLYKHISIHFEWDISAYVLIWLIDLYMFIYIRVCVCVCVCVYVCQMYKYWYICFRLWDLYTVKVRLLNRNGIIKKNWWAMLEI